MNVKYDPVVFRRGLAKEHREHPTMPMRSVKILVKDHLREYGNRAYPKPRK